ncbi:lysophospholipid acyltransferase [Aquipseudomonas alcaligenes]|uniref:Lipid A biosynthesis lauroyl acyltransferase n=1 Tax=Aquipseudomonas alcaligenes TaxID=43263 RepID=A0AA37FNF0_AQUAC|nr:lysophospholipid acyltransferase [Pseudomonas alcaligenes]BCR22491.1 lipid A biosynthesis lauroyl acyltransferase [Pseudomonas alcaligenes]GIZ68569.1 lipid A biosynthesis lauroyl acyltransferase [Pseudomonas alcaligenes]GIZ72952.1 lipid A biosynthesis lauroyl acyltransferase [Pseudomonas alcaligenes]GIZ77327.1 lipid A biosynthesis lauroyl acyltransferase [Pseudomonas alcaligenes]GIZ81612.1 lipid A biosynthesis lauroyl acyltransferase [Pseudomonas alcaligenes]
MEKLKGALAVGFLRLLALLPWGAVQATGSAIGWLMWKLPNGSREVVRINLAKCFPELSAAERERLVGQTLRDIGKTLTESACAWIWPVERTLGLVREVEGLEVLQAALASGKGVVGVASHLGNWEVLNHYFCSQCKPVIFYRPPKLQALDELLQKQRAQLGNRVAPSTKEGILSVIKEVRRGGVVGIPADPEPSRSSGVFVPFCGIQALTSKFVPGMLAGGKAVGLFLNAVRLPDNSGFKVIFEAVPEDMYSEDPQLSAAAMSRTLERYVRAYPSQYLWSMKRFKKRPDGEKKWY